MSTYTESPNTLEIYEKCDVLVVGSGAAGHSAAIAAARAGCKDVVLMERYGYSGGDVTGGYVIMVPNLSWYNKQFVRGLMEEWFARLSVIPDAVRAPAGDELGSEDPVLIDFWKSIHDCVSRGGYDGCKPSCLVRSVYFEPNQLKIEMDKMLLEYKDSIRVMYHSWGAKPIMEGNTCKGVIFESKEGRKVVMAKVVIDATGDGDLFCQTGAPYASLADGETRSSTTALVWRIGGVNYDAFEQWKRTRPEAANALRTKLSEIAGFRSAVLPSNQNDIVWINNWHADMDCTKIADQTKTEMETRDTMRTVLAYLKEVCPLGFRNAFIYDIAPQLGTRCSKRLKGEYIMTANDFAFSKEHEDVIAWHSTICQINDCGPVEIPYRAILPQNVDGMLCPGRHLSADNVAIDWLNLIPQCVGTGQAAGVAAAVAVADGVSVKEVNIKKVQDILVSQDVPLPRRDDVDASYTELCKAHNYGLDTALAKKAKAAAEGKGEDISKYRQW
ncbi:MAG: FAD-dependent oxidoreductase [Oscillospiraceae bacterium]|nr:FAD-dependent oxidoreductase [Oscillospiraceae bacterium]